MLQLKKSAYSWWWESHNGPRQSRWLQSTLTELDEKTETMLKLIDEDADSFAQRAEMYYKKRPELVNMVEDFYRSYRALAERFDQLKSETGNRDIASSRCLLHVSKTTVNADGSSEQCESLDLDDSEPEFDDPESDEETQIDYSENNQTESTQSKKVSQRSGIHGEDANTVEILRLREEIARLQEENRNQKAEMLEMSEKKREVIRQLCTSIVMMMDENSLMRKLMKDASKSNFLDLSKWKWDFPGKLFNGSFSLHTHLVAL